ncbi:hypothetical protein [Pseudonocardia sp. D17]|uniref:hypothetical protein n=1 Tax=Pseudonocardia sp. D17 TaxID=882661 RepID=UPI002B3DADB4|nr:hypothetical protein PSD17_02930 [Pseudonocardia sp. D17]
MVVELFLLGTALGGLVGFAGGWAGSRRAAGAAEAEAFWSRRLDAVRDAYETELDELRVRLDESDDSTAGASK